MLAMRIFLLTFLLPFTGFAIVDMRTANYAETWTDLDFTGSGFDLKVARTYNSKTVYNGMFGFGWCSDFETKLEITSVNTMRVTECGAGQQIEFRPKNFDGSSLNKIITQIMKEVRERNKGRDEQYFKNLEGEIRRDDLFRDEFARQLKISGSVNSGVTYFAEGRPNEEIIKTATGFTRRTADGITQTFNSTGRLMGFRDKNGNSVEFTYAGNNLARVTDTEGNSLQFKYAPNSKYVTSVTGPKGLTSQYRYKGESLIENINAWNNKYSYEYDDMYNLTKVIYPDKSTIEITYNKDKDWVTSFKGRDNCLETYKYSDNPKDPFNNYKSDVQKKCGDRVTNKSSYEFWHQTKADGARYLAKSKAVVNDVAIETEYHPVHGRPTVIARNGVQVKYEYYPNGQLKTRSEPQRVARFKYENACNKAAEVSVTANIITPAGDSRKPSKVLTKTLVTKFIYNTKTCNLDEAKNSDGQYAKLKYDRRGRITQIIDQTKKLVNIQYDERSNKPSVVSRPGLGTIKFKYKPSGEIDKIDSDDEPLVAIQVATMFSNLLEIIGPATSDNPI
jgi:hypothetical protein